MKHVFLWALCGLVVCIGEAAKAQQAEKCATHQILQQNLAAHPDLLPLWEHKRIHLQQQDEAYTRSQQNHTAAKTTANVTIPVVFHVVLTQAQLDYLGGINGVRIRMLSQLDALNADFSGRNSDSTSIPAAFKPLFDRGSIQFAPAHRTPSNAGTEGFEIRTTTIQSFDAFTPNQDDIKSTAGGGLDAWDPDKYLNIWVCNLSQNNILGFATPPSFVGGSLQKKHTGVVLRYGVFGKKTFTSQNYSPATNDLGRTATHEIGHFFELEHTFGQNGACPGSGDIDDGISDTPPQAGQTYSSGGQCPPFPKTDFCTSTGNGIMWMNFMDYVDDKCMWMFTKGQGIRMMAQVSPGGLSYSLTQHPEVLMWPTDVAAIEKEVGLAIYPNPTAGRFQLSFANPAGLQEVNVLSLVGQKVVSITTGNKPMVNYDIDLTGMSRGVYLVQCTFATGTVTKKIVLQ